MFRKWVKGVILELLDEKRAEKRKLEAEYEKKISTHKYVMDLDNISTRFDIIEVLRLLDKNGMMFILTDKEAEEFNHIIKKKK